MQEFRDVFVSQVVLLQQTLLWSSRCGAQGGGSLLRILILIRNLTLVMLSPPSTLLANSALLGLTDGRPPPQTSPGCWSRCICLQSFGMTFDDAKRHLERSVFTLARGDNVAF